MSGPAEPSDYRRGREAATGPDHLRERSVDTLDGSVLHYTVDEQGTVRVSEEVLRRLISDGKAVRLDMLNELFEAVNGEQPWAMSLSPKRVWDLLIEWLHAIDTDGWSQPGWRPNWPPVRSETSGTLADPAPWEDIP